MSFILDALRRAEIERGRGKVPGLHAQAEPADLGAGAGSRAGPNKAAVFGVAGFAALLVLAGWWLARPGETARGSAGAGPDAPREAPREVQAALPSKPHSAGAVAAAPQAASGASPIPGASVAGPPLLVAPPVPPMPPAPPTATAPAVARGPLGSAAEPNTPPAANPSSATRNAAAGGKPTLLADLPAAQRAELPQMLIGGAIYSDQPASRFVVVNGLVVREGETAAPGVTLERIGPKSAVIRWREMRIELPI